MKKVVIIDDSLTQLNIAKLAFEKNRWSVCALQDSRQAFDVIFRFAPDLIITDAIMPNISGFELLKTIRENEYVSKIPTIVYSILSETNARFYLKENSNEYFLRKNENMDELLKLALTIVDTHPLEDSYKKSILQAGYVMRNEVPRKKQTILQKSPNKSYSKIVYTETDVKSLYERNYNFSYGDNTLFEDIFETTYRLLDYDLGIIYTDSFSENEKKLFFDVRHVILSPIFQSSILSKFQTKNTELFKKFLSNSRTITSESDFLKILEFDYVYSDKHIAKVKFYSRNEYKWKNEENLVNAIKEGLFYFLKARYINNNTATRKKNDSYITNRNVLGNLKKFVATTQKSTMYLAILCIKNYADLKMHMSKESVNKLLNNIVNKITSFLNETEQIRKNSDNEYSIILFAKDDMQALGKLNYILNAINVITVDGFKTDAIISASACEVESGLNVYEAEKRVRKLLETTTPQEKAVIG